MVENLPKKLDCAVLSKRKHQVTTKSLDQIGLRMVGGCASFPSCKYGCEYPPQIGLNLVATIHDYGGGNTKARNPNVNKRLGNSLWLKFSV